LPRAWAHPDATRSLARTFCLAHRPHWRRPTSRQCRGFAGRSSGVVIGNTRGGRARPRRQAGRSRSAARSVLAVKKSGFFTRGSRKSPRGALCRGRTKRCAAGGFRRVFGGSSKTFQAAICAGSCAGSDIVASSSRAHHQAAAWQLRGAQFSRGSTWRATMSRKAKIPRALGGPGSRSPVF